MLNTQKLLYVLPDLAYIAELLPDKKPYTFAIQSFKQINGEFLNETQFVAENIVKLVNKLEEGEEYFLILPDFLFTNTIVSVKETSDTKIKETLFADTLPGLGLKEDTHLIETVVLNQLKGTTRVQLSAIEKSVLSIFKVAIAEKDIKIAGICPLSWAVKSLISLEPSISVLQMGSNLYTAQQYIGVDQATTASIGSPENIIETIKTLKGAESSIQTVYLCTNSIVEDKLKEQLSKILPLQQMATKDSDTKIPSYVSQIITASMRTLNVPDFSVPTFKLAKATPEEKEQYTALITSSVSNDDEDDLAESELPKPKVIPGTESTKVSDAEDHDAQSTEEKDEEISDDQTPPNIEDIKEVETEKPELPDIDSKENSTEVHQDDNTDTALAGVGAAVIAGSAAAVTPVITPSVVTATEEQPTISDESPEPKAPTIAPEAAGETLTTPADETITAKSEENTSASNESESATPPVVIGSAQIDAPGSSDISDKVPNKDGDQDIDLSQFTQNNETAPVKAVEKPVIKNKSGVKNMMKMILITTGVFILTVAIGIAVGLAILKYSGSDKQTETPIVEVEEPVTTPSPTPEPTPAATASSEINKEELKILVVNATTKAGYAGQISTKLKAADFTDVTGGNAKGEYEDEGNFVFLKETNDALIKDISEATGLTLTEDDAAKAEDAQGQYDIIIVLAE